MSSGVYSVLPGETLRHLVERAGGVTADAYLYGSEFTRESTRRVQQQRLNEYIDQITLQVSANATNNFGRSLSVADSTAATAAAQQNQNVIASLRQIRATGRIVLELPVDANNVSQLPDLPLEDGDSIDCAPSTIYGQRRRRRLQSKLICVRRDSTCGKLYSLGWRGQSRRRH